MPFLEKADLTPPLYQEIIDLITRGDDAIIDKAINNAVGEMKAYLNRYDLEAIFGDTPTYEEEHLKSIGKDIACWHLIKLGNPNIDMAVFRTAYEDAIKFLKMVMKGEADPLWPLRPANPDDLFDASGHIGSASNIKRTNHY